MYTRGFRQQSMGDPKRTSTTRVSQAPDVRPRHRPAGDGRPRARHTYGTTTDHFDHPQCVGWTWTGAKNHPGCLAAVLSMGEAGTKHMGTACPNTTFRDATGHWPEPVTTGDDGSADSKCKGGSVSVWLPV